MALTDKKGTGNIGRPSMFNISKLNTESGALLAVAL